MTLNVKGVLASTCLGLSTALLGSSAPAAQQFGVGVHNVLLQQVDTAVFPLGLSIRTDVQWRGVEKGQSGQYSFDSYAALDNLFTEASQKGIRPIAVLCCAPKMYDQGDLPKSDAAIQAYVNYVKFVVAHLKGRVDQFEVWNEWNLNTGTKITPRVWGQAEDYVKLLKAASAAIKSVNPNAVVIGGVVGGTDGKWIDKFIQAGGLSYLDGFSVHPYVFHHAHGKPDSREFIWSNTAIGAKTANGQMMAGTPEEAMTWVDEVKARLDHVSTGKRIPIYISEFGWPSSTNSDGVSETVAAAYLQRFMLMARTRPWIAGTYWYDWIDDGADSNNDEHRFGLRRQNGDPKPNYQALAAIKDILTSSGTATQIVGSNGDITVSGTLNGNQQYSANWSPSDGSNAKPVTITIK